MTWILPAVLGGITTAGVLYFVYLSFVWKSERDLLQHEVYDLFDKVLESEKECGTAQRELGFLKDAWLKLVNNPIQAMISNEQFGALLQMLSAKIEFERQDVQNLDKKKVN